MLVVLFELVCTLVKDLASTGVGAVGAGIVFSIGAPSGSVEVWGSDAGDGVGTSFGVAQLALQ